LKLYSPSNFDSYNIPFHNQPSFVIINPGIEGKKTMFYLDASMTAEIKIKFCWMADFGINNSP